MFPGVCCGAGAGIGCGAGVCWSMCSVSLDFLDTKYRRLIRFRLYHEQHETCREARHGRNTVPGIKVLMGKDRSSNLARPCPRWLCPSPDQVPDLNHALRRLKRHVPAMPIANTDEGAGICVMYMPFEPSSNCRSKAINPLSLSPAPSEPFRVEPP